ncbi:MAG: hypothetical protein HY526_06310 [Betaproteobacteria bacterium]|nr:hypothetical protein [Betaproteobacteria bacterium]
MKCVTGDRGVIPEEPVPEVVIGERESNVNIAKLDVRLRGHDMLLLQLDAHLRGHDSAL